VTDQSHVVHSLSIIRRLQFFATSRDRWHSRMTKALSRWCTWYSGTLETQEQVVKIFQVVAVVPLHAGHENKLFAQRTRTH